MFSGDATAPWQPCNLEGKRESESRSVVSDSIMFFELTGKILSRGKIQHPGNLFDRKILQQSFGFFHFLFQKIVDRTAAEILPEQPVQSSLTYSGVFGKVSQG